MFRNVVISLAAMFCVAFLASPAAAAAVHPGDEVVVTVFDHPELSATVLVDGTSHISIPLAGNIGVAGLDAKQIAERVQQTLRTYLRQPVVDAQLKTQMAVIFISGGPGGTLKYEPGETLMAALGDLSPLVHEVPGADGTPLAAGDLTDLQRSRLDLHRIGVIRDDKALGTYDAVRFSAEGGSGPRLQPGDTLSLVYKANAVRVMGSVQRPGMAYLSDDEPLSDAIAQTGGILLTAATSRIELRRNGTVQMLALGDPIFTQPGHNGDTITVPTAPRVSIVGMVEKPGAVVLKTDRTLLTALYEAGGPSKWADLTHVVVAQNGVRTSYDVTRLTFGDLSQNPPLADGDLVIVPEGHKISLQTLFQGLLSAAFLLK